MLYEFNFQPESKNTPRLFAWVFTLKDKGLRMVRAWQEFLGQNMRISYTRLASESFQQTSI